MFNLESVRVVYRSEHGDRIESEIFTDGEIAHDEDFTYNADEAFLLSLISRAVTTAAKLAGAA